MGIRSQGREIIIFSLIMSCFLGAPGWGQEIASPAVPKESVEAAYRPKRLALVVGINEFQDPSWRSLHYAVNDADAMAAALRNPDVSYFDQVIELTKPWETTRDGIIEALRQLGNQNMNPDDVVLVYISTHGTLAKDRDNQLHQYLVTCDTRFDDIPATGLDMDQLNRIFNSLTSKRKVLIIASCHSGQGKSELPPDVQTDLSHLKSGFFVKPIETASEATVVIGASDWGETALEDPKLQHDIYTYFFLKGMTSYDRNEDGAVSISEAHDYAQRQTYYYTHGQQRPFAHSDIFGSDPIILTGAVKAEGKPVVFSYSDKLSGDLLQINGQEKGALPDGFTTSSGWNHIAAVNADGHGKERLIYVRNGERIDVDRMIEHREQAPLGVVGGYRMAGSAELANDVLPGLPMYGMAYNIGGFPFTSTDLRLETTFGRALWTADLDSGARAEVTANVLEANLELLFTRRYNRSEFFAGPAVGGLAMIKDIAYLKGSESRQSGTVCPGVIAGLRFRLYPEMNLEIADRVTYAVFNVNNKTESAVANEIAATVYFSPRALLLRR